MQRVNWERAPTLPAAFFGDLSLSANEDFPCPAPSPLQPPQHLFQLIAVTIFYIQGAAWAFVIEFDLKAERVGELAF